MIFLKPVRSKKKRGEKGNFGEEFSSERSVPNRPEKFI